MEEGRVKKKPTVQRILSLLRALELIEYKGSKRTGYYVLTEKGKWMFR